jgi:hypothetical protein
MQSNHITGKACTSIIAIAFIAAFTSAQAEIIQPNQSLSVKVPFDTKEAEHLLEPGSSTFKGRLETTFKKGLATKTQHFYGARQQITLLPMTSYLAAWNQRFGKDPEIGVVFIDNYILPFSARTISDENGNFEFTGLKPGKYLMMAQIPYKVDGYVRTETGQTQYNINWAASTITASPVYDTSKAKLDLVHSIYKIVEVFEGAPTVFKE